MSNGSYQNFGQGQYQQRPNSDQDHFQTRNTYGQKTYSNNGYNQQQDHYNPDAQTYNSQGHNSQNNNSQAHNSQSHHQGYNEQKYEGYRATHTDSSSYSQQDFYSNSSENQPFVLPEPIRALSQHGLISMEEEALAKSFYREVCESGLLPKLIKDAHSHVHQRPEFYNANNKEALARVRGIFALLDAVDDRMLATVCALILELASNGENRPLSVEEVGRRVMGYHAPDANRAAGGTLLRAALWMIRFGYNNPTVCTAMMHEKQMKLRTTTRPHNRAA